MTSVLLNRYTPEDVEDHLAGEDEETARQFGWWPKRSTRQSVQRSFPNVQTTGQTTHSAEVSYWTAAPYRGRGVAQRALRLLCLQARDQAITHLEAHISVNNPASPAVATTVGCTPTDRFHDEGNLMIRYVFDPALPTTDP